MALICDNHLVIICLWEITSPVFIYLFFILSELLLVLLDFQKKKKKKKKKDQPYGLQCITLQH